MSHLVSPAELSQWLMDGQELALLDVRESGQFGWSHLFHAVNIPYSILEQEAARLVPRLTTRIVLVDEDGQLAPRAARQLAQQGYDTIHLLAGGVQGWQAAGGRLFAGVHVPSKTFGELIEHTCHTPSISVQALAERLAAQSPVVIIDGRTFEEFQQRNIPGGINCPNGELALRIDGLVPDSTTPIVVNCAGRTRSIIGAQTLLDLGIDNPVLALENGTQGWHLADLALEHGATRRHPDHQEDVQAVARARARADALMARHGIPTVNQATTRSWLSDTTRTTYLCDVRTREEFLSGSLPTARHTPGGQLVQTTDAYLGVLGARVVLFDSENVRAITTAHWLQQMGWDVHVLAEGVAADLGAPSQPPSWAPPTRPVVDTETLAQWCRQPQPPLLLDVRPSMQYRAGHLDGAAWGIRPLLAQWLTQATASHGDRPVVLIGDASSRAALAHDELTALGVSPARLWIHRADEPQWRSNGLPVVSTPEEPTDERCIDFLFFVHDRHEGNKAAARQYLAWEMNLVGQMGELEQSRYRLRHPH